MMFSERGIELTKDSEGFFPTPYICPAGYATIGFGSRFYKDGTEVTLNDPPITEEQATQLLYNTLVEYEEAVDRLVTVELTQGQYDCLVDFTYNVGINAFKSSTLLKLLNKGNYDGACNELEKWTRGGGHTLPGLVKRRKKEQELFNEE